MSAPEAIRRGGRKLASAVTRRWPPRSRLFLVGEAVGWSIDHDVHELGAIAGRLGVAVAPPRLLNASRDQAAFYGSQFTLLREPWRPPPHALATAYFHGRPGTPGYPEFDHCYQALCAHHEGLARVQVSHEEMRDVVLSSGIDPAKVRLIRIGVDARLFEQTAGRKEEARSRLDLPQDAFVVGSFQKDGVGFGEGSVPKLIKGPDVLLAALQLLYAQVPQLHVVLSGPARGYVCAGLERLGVPYRHLVARRYSDLGELYAALDGYVVPARQEGGPKGVLEAMASGVPVVTTRVGQAAELVEDGVNGWLADVEDAEGLARALVYVARRPPELTAVVAAGRETARANSYDAQVPHWRDFFDGFVERA